MPELEVLATGLRFPEGPVAMPDGSVLLVELGRGTLTRMTPAGVVEVVAELGGAPNGLAVGPDGMVYVCNNGGYYRIDEVEGLGLVPTPTGSAVGSIQRVDPSTGAFDTLYDGCDGRPLVAPNDLVFDRHGGFWFTDHGVAHGEHASSPGVLYATADGSTIRAAVGGTDGTNGIGLSPEGDRLYVAETGPGLIWAFDVVGPGELAPPDPATRTGGRVLHDAVDGLLFDSLAVDGAGWVCAATIGMGLPGGVTSVAPDGSATEFLDTGDFLTTNICFGGPDGRTAFITCSSTGRLVAAPWPRPGLRLAH